MPAVGGAEVPAGGFSEKLGQGRTPGAARTVRLARRGGPLELSRPRGRDLLWQFAFLRACEHATSSYSAVQVAALESGREPGQVLAELAVWLPIAFELGFLRWVV